MKFLKFKCKNFYEFTSFYRCYFYSSQIISHTIEIIPKIGCSLKIGWVFGDREAV